MWKNNASVNVKQLHCFYMLYKNNVKVEQPKNEINKRPQLANFDFIYMEV